MIRGVPVGPPALERLDQRSVATRRTFSQPPTRRAALYEWSLRRAVRLARRQSAARAIAIAAAVLGGLVGEAAMVAAIRPGRRGGAAIAEF